MNARSDTRRDRDPQGLTNGPQEPLRLQTMAAEHANELMKARAALPDGRTAARANSPTLTDAGLVGSAGKDKEQQ